MRKIHDLHVLVDSPFKQRLQKEADSLEISLSELIRHKLENSMPLDKTKFLLEKLIGELNKSQDSRRSFSESGQLIQ
jgi:hypothetical protein